MEYLFIWLVIGIFTHGLMTGAVYIEKEKPESWYIAAAILAWPWVIGSWVGVNFTKETFFRK